MGTYLIEIDFIMIARVDNVEEMPIAQKCFVFLSTSTLFEIKEVCTYVEEEEGLRLTQVLLMLRWC